MLTCSQACFRALPSPSSFCSLKSFPSQSSFCFHPLPCLQSRLCSFSTWRTTMGIKGLTKLLSENAPRALTEQKFENYTGRKIAIDASLCLYQFLAPSEAEAECVSLCKSDKVYAVASEDMDSLTFGAPRFVRHLMEPTYGKVPILEYNISKVLEDLQLNMDQFIDLCILCGCDYCDTIKGIGPKTALKLIHQHGDIETVLENIKKSRYQIPDHWQYQEARCLFREPLVTPLENQPDFQWTAPDEEGLKTFLVEGNSFNHDRVLKAVEKIEAARHKSS